MHLTTEGTEITERIPCGPASALHPCSGSFHPPGPLPDDGIDHDVQPDVAG